MEALGAQQDPPRDVSFLRKQGVAIPLRVDGMGRHILRAVDFGKDASLEVRGPIASASYFERAFKNKRPNLPH